MTVTVTVTLTVNVFVEREFFFIHFSVPTLTSFETMYQVSLQPNVTTFYNIHESMNTFKNLRSYSVLQIFITYVELFPHLFFDESQIELNSYLNG